MRGMSAAEPVPAAEADPDEPERVAVVAARNEADRIGATIAALKGASPGISVFVADDASDDGTADVALVAGATVISRGRPHGKGGNMTAACEAALDGLPLETTVLLCDGDLGDSAARLTPLLEAVEAGRADLAIAVFSRKVGGGVGAAKGAARWAIRRASGFEASEPISGQRAMAASTLRALLPFAPSYGMETAMTIDAVRAGYRVAEVEADLSHRATGRTLGGFVHRGRQLRDILAAYLSRRRG
jgi:glycosyltransferase involved in cell wall biosynthesis